MGLIVLRRPRAHPHARRRRHLRRLGHRRARARSPPLASRHQFEVEFYATPAEQCAAASATRTLFARPPRRGRRPSWARAAAISAWYARCAGIRAIRACSLKASRRAALYRSRKRPTGAWYLRPRAALRHDVLLAGLVCNLDESGRAPRTSTKAEYIAEIGSRELRGLRRPDACSAAERPPRHPRLCGCRRSTASIGRASATPTHRVTRRAHLRAS